MRTENLNSDLIRTLLGTFALQVSEINTRGSSVSQAQLFIGYASVAVILRSTGSVLLNLRGCQIKDLCGPNGSGIFVDTAQHPSYVPVEGHPGYFTQATNPKTGKVGYYSDVIVRIPEFRALLVQAIFSCEEIKATRARLQAEHAARFGSGSPQRAVPAPAPAPAPTAVAPDQTQSMFEMLRSNGAAPPQSGNGLQELGRLLRDGLGGEPNVLTALQQLGVLQQQAPTTEAHPQAEDDLEALLRDPVFG